MGDTKNPDDPGDIDSIKNWRCYCPPTKEEVKKLCDRQQRSAWMKMAPFVGGTIAANYSGTSTHNSVARAKLLTDQQQHVSNMVASWRKNLTSAVFKDTQAIQGILKLISDPSDKDSYFGLCEEVLIQPLRAQQYVMWVEIIAIAVIVAMMIATR